MHSVACPEVNYSSTVNTVFINIDCCSSVLYSFRLHLKTFSQDIYNRFAARAVTGGGGFLDGAEHPIRLAELVLKREVGILC